MKLCNYRGSRNAEGHCYLRTKDIAPSKDTEHYIRTAYVFQGVDWEGHLDPRQTINCAEPLAEVCPYRIHTPRPKPEKKPPREKMKCPHCGLMHTVGSLAIEWCKAYEYIKQNSNQPFDPNGTIEEFYPDWALSLPSVNAKLRFWQTLASYILERDGFTCQDCGRPFEPNTVNYQRWNEVEVHHITPRTKGGSDHPKNLKTVCAKCHRKYTDELLGELGPIRAKQNRINKAKEQMPKSLEEFA